MAAAVVEVGHTMYLALNTGSVATPVWDELDEIGDVNVDQFSLNTAELKRRASVWTKVVGATFAPIGFTFNYIHGLDLTTFDLIRADFLGRTANEYIIMNDSVAAGSEGIKMPVLLTEFPWNQPLEDISDFSIRGQLAYMVEAAAEVDPSWYEPTA